MTAECAIPAIRRHRVRHPRASRGQALIMAVLLMFLLAGLGGVFIAMINQTLVQTARALDRARLNSVAEAGLSYVEKQLRTSPDGADWRPDNGPDESNPGWVHYNDGFYKLTLTYGRTTPISGSDPFMSNPLQRYLKVDVEARFALANMPNMVEEDDPSRDAYERGYYSPKRFLTRKITAYVPLALTDYLVWVTNLSGESGPAVLGNVVPLRTPGDAQGKLHTLKVNPADTAYADVTWWNDPLQLTTTDARYLSLYHGPIRSDGDLELGDVRIDLTRDELNSTQSETFGALFNVKRTDTVDVLGKLTAMEGASVTNRRVMLSAYKTPLTLAAASPTTQANLKGFDPVAMQSNTLLIVPYLRTKENTPLLRRLQAPKFDQAGLERYRALTRDSGFLKTVGVDTVNTGSLGWGEGIYIYNPAQIQHSGNLEALRQEWVSGTGECWQAGAYRPRETARAVEMILHDWEYASGSAVAVKAPYIELVSVGQQAGNPSYDDRLLYDRDGNKVSRITMPYPRNGVIFAEGNVVVKGNLPASVAYTYDKTAALDANRNPLPLLPILDSNEKQRPGGWNSADGSIGYYVTPTNRRFDLTIVSGGTVYIDGNVLSPSRRQDIFVTTPYLGGHYLTWTGSTYLVNKIGRGDPYDSKVALLATDNVCLNPTRLYDTLRKPDGAALTAEYPWPQDSTTGYFAASAANSAVTFSFTTAGRPHPRMNLLLRQAADSTNTAAVMQLSLRQQFNEARYRYLWSTDSALSKASAVNLYMGNSASIFTLFPWVGAVTGTPPHDEWPDYLYGGPQRTISGSFGVQCWNLRDVSRYTAMNTELLDLSSIDKVFFGYGSSVSLQLDWQDQDWTPDDGAAYQLYAGTNAHPKSGALVTCLDLQVDALIYAQRGSWYIIPGSYWFDEERDNAADVYWPFPGAREPYDVRITINGAIAENHTAPAEDERKWIEHWRGANIWYYDTDGNGPDLLDPANADWSPDEWRWKTPNAFDDNRRLGILYTYDATLALPVCYEVDPAAPGQRYYRPRLPKLPVGPELISINPTRGT